MSFHSCEKDNLDGPDAVFSGELRDRKTGELIPQEVSSGSRVYYIELGWDNPPVQNFVMKSDGTFNNSMMFSGNYKVIMDKGNYVPLDTLDIKINKGGNSHVFEVNPYLRILEPEITKSERIITARFKLEQVSSNNVYRISLFAHSHIEVSNSLNFVNRTEELNRSITDGEQFVLSINLDDYSSTLLTGKSYYFRIGAQSHGNETKYNYAASIKIAI
jgi:hypothetical protein